MRESGLNKFWAWMKEKQYGHKDANGVTWLSENPGTPFGEDIENAPSQMLVGYQLEYIREQKLWSDDKLGKLIQQVASGWMTAIIDEIIENGT